ncbi:MAG: hypothetical protein VKL39_01720 [Leptolyngbyaceae bacterium]|nr:hypothetical protein [Leptolyngbyaceae bacterium]
MQITQETLPQNVLSASDTTERVHSPETVCSVKKLPYTPNQRVEFLNIQAETEALLQQLYVESYRRRLAQQS